MADRTPRLCVSADLKADTDLFVSPEHAHYLFNVMRVKVGDTVRLFNGRDGEWSAATSEITKKKCILRPLEQTRAQTPDSQVSVIFAPLKQARLDYMIQKAVEMGADRLFPVVTQHTQVTRINENRLRANAIEAAEQCGSLTIPHVSPLVKLKALMSSWPESQPDTHLIFCDEEADHADPIETLRSLCDHPVACLIGPEGGFSEEERATLLRQPFVNRISLGKRILRADTALVAVLALIQTVRGG